ncbi:MAG: LysM peptidoglycan-binding domain-containing protein [Anaerolineales bacterium]|nr:LysM peptidoglycan-binding domain-containing protein [Anaerolineales bacterium]
MFDDVELSPYLDWLLDSGQAPREALLEALVQEYYPAVYYLAAGILDREKLARQAAAETFSTAMLSLHTFSSRDGAQAWLFRIALRVCQKYFRRLWWFQTIKASLWFSSEPADFGDSVPQTALDASIWLAVDGLSPQHRILVLFEYLLKWGHKNTSAALRIPESRLGDHLRYVRSILLTNLWTAKREADEQIKGENLDQMLSDSLSRRWPEPKFSPNDLGQIVRIILWQLEKRSVQKRGAALAKEVLLIGGAIVLVFGAYWATNRYWPEEGIIPADIPVAMDTAEPVSSELAPDASPIPVTAQLASQPTPFPTDVFYTVRPGDTLASIAAQLGVSEEELRLWNRLPPGVSFLPGQQVLMPGLGVTGHSHEATRVAPALQYQPLEEPYAEDEIRQRLNFNQALFHTVWLDALYMNFGPQAYIGPPRLYRTQAWLSQDQYLVLVGLSDGSLQEVWLRSQDKLYLAKPGARQPWFIDWDGQEPGSSQMIDALNPFFSIVMDGVSLRPDQPLQVVGREDVADRSTLVVDSYLSTLGQPAFRLWLDDRTGLVLRHEIYAGLDNQTLQTESIITAINYDVDFPQDLFDASLPWRGGFAQDYQGDPLPTYQQDVSLAQVNQRPRLPLTKPPEGFDPARSQLTFQYPERYDVFYMAAQIDLFADDYFLGVTLLGNPWEMICQRSPDGLRLAYVSRPAQEYSWASALHWLSLTGAPDFYRTPLDEIAVLQFAFSPDSRSLAVFGYQGALGQGNLYVVNLDTYAARPVLQLGDAKSLVWSPDGRFVGMIARYDPASYYEHVVVVDVETGEITYSSSIDFESNATREWPMVEWGVEFPVDMPGLDGCSASPVE